MHPIGERAAMRINHRELEIKRTFTVNKPIHEVWDVLGNRFGEAYKWATGIYHSAGYGVPQTEGASCNNRACATSQGNIKEAIRTFDVRNYHLEYEVVEGFPGFVKKGGNNWRLSSKGARTQVDIHFIVETQGIMGFIMSPLMKKQLGKVFDQAVLDFKYYVETGQPSPVKTKENAKRAKAA
ncbi:MAG: SRPBCC family protein [Bacteroidota bacterium]